MASLLTRVARASRISFSRHQVAGMGRSSSVAALVTRRGFSGFSPSAPSLNANAPIDSRHHSNAEQLVAQVVSDDQEKVVEANER